MTEFVRSTQPWNFQEVKNLLDDIERSSPVTTFNRQQMDYLAQRAKKIPYTDRPNALRGTGGLLRFAATSWLGIDRIRNTFPEDTPVLEIMEHLESQSVQFISRERFQESQMLIGIPMAAPEVDKTKVLATALTSSRMYMEHAQLRLELASVFWLLDQRGVRVQG